MTSYIAGARMLVDGVIKRPGDPIPEAAEWKNLSAHLKVGSVRADDGLELIAARPLLIAGKVRAIGEPVPEAKTWANLDVLLRLGDIVKRPYAEPHEEKPTKRARG